MFLDARIGKASDPVRISIFYATLFLTVGVFLPFFPVWLENKGHDFDTIALLLGIPLLMRVIATPYITSIADKWPNRRICLLAYTIAAVFAFACLALPLPFALLIIALCIFSIFWHSAIPLADMFALTAVRRGQADFGSMRFWGSASFIVANIGGGLLIARMGEGIVFPAMMFSLAICCLAICYLPPGRKPVPISDQKALGLFAHLKQLDFMPFALAGGFIHSSHALAYGFGSLYWLQLGHSEFDIGLFWAIGVLCEVVLFMKAKRYLKSLTPETMMLCAGIGAIIRWCLTSFLTGFWPILLLQSLHAISFALAYTALQQSVIERVSEDDTPGAQGAITATGGLTMALVTLICGSLYTAFGAISFIAMAGIAAIGCSIMLWYKFYHKTCA